MKAKCLACGKEHEYYDWKHTKWPVKQDDGTYKEVEGWVCGKHAKMSPTKFMEPISNKRWVDVHHQRRKHAKDMIQPVDKHGNFNPEFKKAYGYNPVEDGLPGDSNE